MRMLVDETSILYPSVVGVPSACFASKSHDRDSPMTFGTCCTLWMSEMESETLVRGNSSSRSALKVSENANREGGMRVRPLSSVDCASRRLTTTWI